LQAKNVPHIDTTSTTLLNKQSLSVSNKEIASLLKAWFIPVQSYVLSINLYDDSFFGVIKLISKHLKDVIFNLNLFLINLKGVYKNSTLKTDQTFLIQEFFK